MRNFSSILSDKEIKNIYDSIPKPEDIKNDVDSLDYYIDIVDTLSDIFVDSVLRLEFYSLSDSYKFYLERARDEEEDDNQDLTDYDQNTIIFDRDKIDNKFSSLIN